MTGSIDHTTTEQVPMTRRPDNNGVALGDLVAGTRVDNRQSTVGVVIGAVPYGSEPGPIGTRYRLRIGALWPTGGVVECVVHDYPLVFVPAGDPVVCATCGGKHASAERFIECQVAHLRAAVERHGRPAA